MKGLLIRAWGLILSGYGITPRAPANEKSHGGIGSSHIVRGCIDAGVHRFRSRIVEVVDVR